MCAIKSCSRLCIAVAALITSSACASAQEASYTIAGDVPSPGTYSHPAGEPMDLAQLLEQGGVSGQQGIAAILRRPTLETVSTNSIRPDARPNRTPVAAGDVVVFRRYEPHGVFTPHAVLICGGEPRIVPLGGGSAYLAHAMAAVGLQISQPADVIRVNWGSTNRLSLGGNSVLLHGDVVNVANAGRMSGLRITETFARPKEPVVQTSVAAVMSSDGGLSPVTSASSSLFVPPKPQSATLHIPHADSSSDLVVGTASETRTAAVEFGGDAQMELRVPDSSDAQENTTPFQTVSLESQFSDPETIHLSDSSEPSTADSSSSGILNAVFVVGLLFAIGLIGVGWVRTQQERRLEIETADSAAESTAQVAEFSRAADIQLAEADTTPTSQTVSDDCPVLSAGIDVETVESQSESSSIQQSAEEEIQASHSDVLSAADKSAEIATDDGPWFDANWSSVDAERQTQTESQPKLKVESKPETIATAVVKSDVLEDLLQNRLPMELKQAQLPLQVALFGKPSGPKRLRIDAAHKTIAAPHMASAAKRAQRKTPVAAAAAKKTSNETRHNQQQRSNAEPSAGDASRFDRALNFLEEQSEK